MAQNIHLEPCRKCGATLSNHFCASCGNPKTLTRIDSKYILAEVRSVLNFDKGILYTIKELFLRPGKTVREFINNDRNRIVKPIIFVLFSSLFFIIIQQVLGFSTGTANEQKISPGVTKVFEWVSKNFGIVNVILGFFIGFWTKLFFIKSKYNIYEIFILIFFTTGIGNLIFTFFGVIESITGFANNNLTYIFALLYSAWAIGDFFKGHRLLNYFKGLLAYFLGTTSGSLLLVVIGVVMDIIEKNS